MKHFEKEKKKIAGKQFESDVHARIQVLAELQNAFYDVVAPIMHDLGICSLELCMDGEVSYTQLLNGSELKCLGFCYQGNTFAMMDASQIDDDVMKKKINNEEISEEELAKHKELVAKQIAESIIVDDEHTVADFIDDDELSSHIKDIPLGTGDLKETVDDFHKLHEVDMSKQFDKAKEISKAETYGKRYEQLLEFSKMLSEDDKKNFSLDAYTAEEIAENTNESIEQVLEKVEWLDCVGGKLFVEQQIFDGKLLNEDTLNNSEYSTMLKSLSTEERDHLLDLVNELHDDIMKTKESKNVHKVTLKKDKKNTKKKPE